MSGRRLPHRDFHVDAVQAHGGAIVPAPMTVEDLSMNEDVLAVVAVALAPFREKKK